MTSATVQVPRQRLARWLDNFALRHGEPVLDLGDDELTVSSPDGAVAVIRVPYGPVRNSGDPRADVTGHLAVDRRIGILLARRGGHAIGVVEGERLLASKVGHAYVQGRTKAGGWSQQRYARRRANQAGQAADRATEDAVRILVTEVPGPLAALVCGGDRELCERVLADRRLAGVALLWRPRTILPVGEPRLRTLQEVAEVCTGVRVFLNDEAVGH